MLVNYNKFNIERKDAYEADDRDYYECDIDFDGTYRNEKRIVFSNDGLIYYTEDHYESFELLYGEE